MAAVGHRPVRNALHREAPRDTCSQGVGDRPMSKNPQGPPRHATGPDVEKDQSALSCARSRANPRHNCLCSRGLPSRKRSFSEMTAFHPPQGSALEMALTGALCCYIFQVSFFKVNGNLRCNYVHNWGGAYGLCIQHETTKLIFFFFPPNINSACTKMLHGGRARLWRWRLGDQLAQQTEAWSTQKAGLPRSLDIGTFS